MYNDEFDTLDEIGGLTIRFKPDSGGFLDLCGETIDFVFAEYENPEAVTIDDIISLLKPEDVEENKDGSYDLTWCYD